MVKFKVLLYLIILYSHGLMDRGLFYRPDRSAKAAVQSRRRRRR
jgi:hypothetical protein